ncbi:MAG: DUF4153 domain-containing protein [Oscillospiraceae bacterium]
MMNDNMNPEQNNSQNDSAQNLSANTPPPLMQMGMPMGMNMNMGMGMPMPAPFVKPKTVFNKTEMIYSFAVFVLAFLFMRFAVFNVNGFITTAVYIIISSAAAIFMKRSQAKFTARSRLTFALQIAFSTVYSITSNSFIKLLNTLFLIILLFFMLYQLSGEEQRIPRFLPVVLIKAVFEPFENMSKQPEAAVQSVKKSKIGTNIGFVLIGLIIAIPITAVVGSLLMSADRGVEKMLYGVVDFIFSEDLKLVIAQLITAVPVSFYLFGALFSNAHKTAENRLTDEKCETSLLSWRRLHNAVIYSAVTPICVLYTLFFISQITYFTSAFSGRLPDGYSFAEYARRGFFELLAISIINLVIIILINLLAKKGGKNPVLKGYTAVICFFTLVIIASALSKMVLYVGVYGLTALRVYTSWFMILCAIFFILVLIGCFCDRIKLAKTFSFVFVVMFALLAFSRPDYLIIKYNNMMHASGELPHYSESYALELSDDAYAAYLEDCEPDLDSEFVCNSLADKAESYENDFYSRLNLSSMLVSEKLSGMELPESTTVRPEFY